jgi:host factor-I protein
VAGKISQIKAPDHTQQEGNYLQHLVEERIPVRVRMADNQEVEGLVEFYDATFIRLTREGAPNLFLYKQDLKYLYELARP